DRDTGEPFGHTTIRAQIAWCSEEGVPQMFVTHCGSDIVGGDERRIAAELACGALGRMRRERAAFRRGGLLTAGRSSPRNPARELDQRSVRVQSLDRRREQGRALEHFHAIS